MSIFLTLAQVFGVETFGFAAVPAGTFIDLRNGIIVAPGRGKYQRVLGTKNWIATGPV